MGVCLGKSGIRVTFQSLGLKGILWQGVCAKGGEPGAVQHVGQLRHGLEISLVEAKSVQERVNVLDMVCVEQGIFDS